MASDRHHVREARARLHCRSKHPGIGVDGQGAVVRIAARSAGEGDQLDAAPAFVFGQRLAASLLLGAAVVCFVWIARNLRPARASFEEEPS